ncbi:MAG: AEC family transporter [Actinomycetota bacterium]|jgi:predicted permease|nr:AEC family transporter [Actinomycetota bacterium]
MNFYFKTFIDVLSVTIPIFVVVAIGYIFRKTGIISEKAVPGLNKIAYYLGLTTLIFTSIVKYDLKEIFNIGMVKTLYTTFAIFIVIVFISVYFLKVKRKTKGAIAISSFRCNMAFVGIPIIISAFGDIAGAKSSIIIGFMTPVNIIFSIIFLRILGGQDNERKKYGKLFLSFLKDPLVIAAVAGMLISYFSIPLPKAFLDILNILAGLAIPLALITIGASFKISHIKLNFKFLILVSLLKLIIEPFIAFLVGRYIYAINSIDIIITVILFGMPLAVAAYIMGREYDSDSDFISSALIFSTITSALTITLWLFFLKIFFRVA